MAEYQQNDGDGKKVVQTRKASAEVTCTQDQ